MFRLLMRVLGSDPELLYRIGACATVTETRLTSTGPKTSRQLARDAGTLDCRPALAT